MIKVVVLDTGLDLNNQRFDGCYCGGASFSSKDDLIYQMGEFLLSYQQKTLPGKQNSG